MKACIFDMDGLMFDTERVFVQAWDYAGEQMGLGKTGYMVMKTMGSNVEGCNRIWREEFGPELDTAALAAGAARLIGLVIVLFATRLGLMIVEKFLDLFRKGMRK